METNQRQLSNNKTASSRRESKYNRTIQKQKPESIGQLSKSENEFRYWYYQEADRE